MRNARIETVVTNAYAGIETVGYKDGPRGETVGYKRVCRN